MIPRESVCDGVVAAADIVEFGSVQVVEHASRVRSPLSVAHLKFTNRWQHGIVVNIPRVVGKCWEVY